VGLIRKLLREPTTVLSRESTFANEANLPPVYISQLRLKYEGTRLGKQELHAEVLDDNPYALWDQATLDAQRWHGSLPEMQRIVVAVDPPVTSGEDADECGIVAAGKFRHPDGRDHYIVLEDRTCQGHSPLGWASRAVSCYLTLEADCVVAEVNNGGEMVAQTIKTSNATVPVKSVRATRGKVTRAEPISGLYEQGRVHHHGLLSKLEDQMCDFTTDFDKDVMGYSPDRVDALVWAITELETGGQYSMLDAV
jgi:phage terminase large subunit-like protein